MFIQIYDKTLIDTNIATRKNKGTNYGRIMLKKYLNKLKGKEFYILKFDISKYFYNISHSILKKLIRKKIQDQDVLRIIDDIIDSTDNEYINNTISKLKDNLNINDIPLYRKGYGLPIGNLTSQILAIMYLDELDRYIKEKLKIKYYIRYMDDGILIHEDKEYLKYCLSEIKNILDKYELKLNDKTKIYNIKNGFEFLGFNYFIKNNKIIMKVKSQTKRKFKRKIKKLYKLVKENKISNKKLIQVKNSYIGHLKYGNSNKLIYSTFKKYEQNYNDFGTFIKAEDYI